MNATDAVATLTVAAAAAVVALACSSCRCDRIETGAGTIPGSGLGSGSCCDAGLAEPADAGVGLPKSAFDGPKQFGGDPISPPPLGNSGTTLGAAINAAVDAGAVDDERGTGKRYE